MKKKEIQKKAKSMKGMKKKQSIKIIDKKPFLDKLISNIKNTNIKI